MSYFLRKTIGALIIIVIGFSLNFIWQVKAYSKYCYTKNYSLAHLKKHNNQKIKALTFVVLDNIYDKFRFILNSERTGYKYTFYNYGSCVKQAFSNYNCFFDELNVSFVAEFDGSTNVVTLAIVGEMYMFPTKGIDAGEDGADKFGESDDNIFVLRAIPFESCKSTLLKRGIKNFLFNVK